MTLISTLCSWVNIFGGQKAATLPQVGHFYSDQVGHFYSGANINGSQVQAAQFLRLGFRLGFGGAVTYERATRLRRLAAQLDPGAIVMETDAPDIPPQWLYTTAAQRAAGAAQAANEPGELRRIGAEIAHLRTITADAWATITTAMRWMRCLACAGCCFDAARTRDCRTSTRPGQAPESGRRRERPAAMQN